MVVVLAIHRAEIIAEIKQAVDFGSEDFDVFMVSVSNISSGWCVGR